MQFAKYSLRYGFLIKLISVMVSSISSILIIKVVNVNIYAQYQYYLTLLLIIVSISLAGTQNIFLRRIPKTKSVFIHNKWFRFSIGFSLISFIVYSISMVVYLINYSNYNHYFINLLLVFILFFMIINKIRLNFYNALGYTTEYLIGAQLIRPIILLFVVFYFLFLQSKIDLLYLLIFEFSAVLIIFLWTLKIYNPQNQYNMKINFSKRHSKFFISYGLIAVVQILYSKLDIIYIDLAFNNYLLGNYIYGIKLAELANFVLFTAVTVKLPEIRKLLRSNNLNKVERLIFIIGILSLIISSIIFIIFFIFSDLILLLNEDFKDSIFIATYFIFVNLISGLFVLSIAISCTVLNLKTVVSLLSIMVILKIILGFFTVVLNSPFFLVMTLIGFLYILMNFMFSLLIKKHIDLDIFLPILIIKKYKLRGKYNDKYSK